MVVLIKEADMAASHRACYPETNGLLPLSSHDKSKTPSAKSIPVVVRPIA
jgi:hypothetical protein